MIHMTKLTFANLIRDARHDEKAWSPSDWYSDSQFPLGMSSLASAYDPYGALDHFAS